MVLECSYCGMNGNQLYELGQREFIIPKRYDLEIYQLISKQKQIPIQTRVGKYLFNLLHLSNMDKCEQVKCFIVKKYK